MIIKFKQNAKRLNDLLKKYKKQLQEKESTKKELVEIFLKECREARNDKKLI